MQDSPFANAYKQINGISPQDSFASAYHSQFNNTTDTPFKAAYNKLNGIDPAAQATQKALQSGATPNDLQKAKSQLGENAYIGYCETFVEQAANTPNMGASAADAYNSYAQQGKVNPNIGEAPAGSLIYFAPDESNGHNGHVAISDGQGNIIGATDNGIQQSSLNGWISTTGQRPLGYVTP